MESSAKVRRDYICGATASLLNVVVTFPLNKIMFRQQIDGIRLHKAVNQLLREGPGTWYRGVLPPLIQRTLTVSLMFGTYTQTTHIITHYSTPYHIPYFLTHSLAASTAGSVEAILMPLERAQCLLQVRHFNAELRNTKHVFEVLFSHGLKESYRGLSAVLFRNTLSNILFLGLRDPLKHFLPKPRSQVGDSLNSFISGAGLGCALSTVFFPVNVIKNNMMSKIGGDYSGMWETFKTVYEARDKKWYRLFRGASLNCTRSFMSWGIINMSYDFLIKYYDDNCFLSL